MKKDNIIHKVDQYYSDKVEQHGATSAGVDWNGQESHYLRFDQLCKILPETKFSLLDYGCGFGSLVDFVKQSKSEYEYYGYDISEKMIEQAQQQYPELSSSFTTVLKENEQFDYVIANGIFNVKLKTSEDDWTQYILDTLHEMDQLTTKGFSFNILTSYSDEEYKKDYLHYADPLFYFDYCKKHFSRNVALLHDYELYEFTLLIRK